MRSRRTVALGLLTAALMMFMACAQAQAASVLPGHHSRGHGHSRSRRHSLRTRTYDASFDSAVDRGRQEHDRARLVINYRLSSIARAWARHMASRDVLAHNPRLIAQLDLACPDWLSTGENVARATSAGPMALYRAYMHSPPHRANILNKGYTEVGIATFASTTNGVTTYWNVMDFARGCAS